MTIRGHRVVHVVIAAILVLTLLPNTVVSAQPPTPKSPELTTNLPITASPSPPPNSLDINLLNLLPVRETLLPYKNGEAIAQSRFHSNVDEPINTSQISPGPQPLLNPYELNSTNYMSDKENLIQSQGDQAPLVPQASGYIEPINDPQISPNSLPVINPSGLISVEVNPDKEAILQSKDGKVKVAFPVGAVTEKVRVEYREQRPWQSTGTRMLRSFELNGFAVNRNNAPVKTFGRQLQIDISHTADELRGLDTRSLKLYYLDEKQKRWLPVSSSYNSTTRTLTSTTDHFTYYGEQANPNISGPGQIMAFQVGLQSGTAISRYPIELPPGPGGFQPKLGLVYNSGSVDEMKNKRSLGSWVGIGWTLHPGRISLDEEFNSYSLELNGESYEIISADGSYYTKPDIFFKIVRTSQKWEIWDKSGIYYRFGGTADSEQYHDTSQYYRWDLSLVQDTHNNQMTVSYTRDVMGANVRSAYPEYLRYNSTLVEVHFFSSFDILNDPTDGNLRTDNPKSAGSNPSPKVMENKKLDAIEVKVSGSLVRKYNFAYSTTASSYSSDYGGIYYSGKHTLNSITQVGADGTSTLPAMVFSYQDLQTYLNDSYNPTYTGNPGNPASFSRPHLASVNNGYGATVSFTYTQKPLSTTNDIWTREVVTQRDVNPGIGPVQTNTYEYTGNPAYMWRSWKARYRGFAQVKETDAAGNYIQHYFYTTGLVNGKDADKRTGKEYKTQWYSSAGALLKENTYDWGLTTTQPNKYAFVSQFDSPDNGDGNSYCPVGVAVDSTGNIYVADQGNQRIQKFNSSGTFVTKWGKQGSGNGEFYYPYGTAVDSSSNVYVADYYNHRVQKFSSSGAYITQWGSYGNGNGQFAYPIGIAVDGSGNAYVVDQLNHRIQKFNSSGAYVTQWGSYGTGDGQFSYPYGGIAVSPAGDVVFVADTDNNRIQKFTSSGSFITKWGTQGSGDGQFKLPIGLAVDASGANVYVGDMANQRIQMFSSSGVFIGKVGSYGGGDGQFFEVYGVASGSDGSVYAADTRPGRIQKFTASLVFGASWGNNGYASGGFGSPRGLSTDGSYIYIADRSNSRLYKFDTYGSQVAKWGSHVSGVGQLLWPSGITINGNNLYVAEWYNRILKFDTSGNVLSQWSTGDGQFGKNPEDVAADSSGYIYVTDIANHRIQKFSSSGAFITQWGSYGTGDGQFNGTMGITVSAGGTVYVTDYSNHRVQMFNTNGGYLGQWGSFGTGPGQFNYPAGLGLDADGNVYVADGGNNRIQKFSSSGAYLGQWGSNGPGMGTFNSPWDALILVNGDTYVTDSNNRAVQRFSYLWTTQLNQVDETVGTKTSRTKYFYDSYGNMVKTERHGDTATNSDDSTVYTVFYPNTTNWILNKPARERVYATIMSSDDGGTNLKKETSFYYDGNNSSLTTPPTKGDLTRLEGKKDASNFISSYYTYDTYGNRLTQQDPNVNTTTFTYDTTYHAFPVTRTYPAIGGSSMSESYTWDYGAGKILTEIDVNSQTTEVRYDTFKRPIKIIRPGDSAASPTILHEYLNWGTINQQQVKTTQKINGSNSLWQKRYFDGLGRVVQLQAQGETGKTIVTTTAFSNRGLTDKEYVSQNLDSSGLNGYKTPEAGWKYTTYQYDGLSRVTTTTKPDNQTILHDFTTTWQDTVTNERGKQKRYYYDAFNRLARVEELNDSQAVYATTNYAYDVLNNLTQVLDNSNNTTTVNYDWLSRKTSMSDPDMGTWSYTYDSNSNLLTQTDAKSQTITFSYDVLNRLTCKSSAASCGGTVYASYSYDSVTSGNYGKGLRTGMTDAPGSAAFTYDARGRLIKEDKTIDSTVYTTQFSYDSADRLATVTYPTGEVVTQGYNGRGLPYSLSSGVSGTIVSSALYNQLGQPTDINLGNGLTTTFGYWDVGGAYDTTGGYYSKLWEIKTFKTGSTLQDVKHSWDAGGNLTQRVNVVDSNETENFSYDFLDRLLSVSGAYSESYAYNQIGNITSKGGQSYTYGTKPHAVTQVGSTTYAYDNNGNMTTRGSQTLTWDVENRPISVNTSPTTSFVYDGDGKRVKKTEGGITTIYVNKYYEKRIGSPDEITLYYYLGDRLVALKKGGTLRYVNQDHLTGTSVTSDTSGNMVASIKYMPFGDRRNSTGTIDTDRQFTGQRLDGTGLYYYGARYYDPGIGRFISADTAIQITPGVMRLSRSLNMTGYASLPTSDQPPNYPQTLNRYSYVANNPLTYVDADGHQMQFVWGAAIGAASYIGTTMIVNGIKYSRQEGNFFNAVKKRGFEGLNKRDLIEAAVLGSLTGGFGATQVVKGVLKEFTPIVMGIAGSEGQYWVDVAEGQTEATFEGAVVAGGVGIISGGIEIAYPGKSSLQSIGVGLVSGTSGGVLGSIGDFVSGRGAGIIGGIALTGSGSGTDEAGNSVFRVSIDGESPIWVTSDNANSMLRNGEDVKYLF